MLDRFFERHRGQIKSAASQLAQPFAPNEPAIQTPESAKPHEEAETATTAPPSDPTPGQRQAQARATSAKARQERFEEARRWHAEGESIRLIAKEMGLSRGAVRRYLRQDHCPDWRPGQARPNRLDRFQAWIDEQIQNGQSNAIGLHRGLNERGYDGGYDAVRRYLTRRLAALGQKRKRASAATCRRVPAPSARSLSYDLIRWPDKRSSEQQGRVSILAGIDDQFREVLARAEELAAMLRKQLSLSLREWLEKAEGSTHPRGDQLRQGHPPGRDGGGSGDYSGVEQWPG